MDLVPWRPFGELSLFRREMDKLWGRVFGVKAFVKGFPEAWSPSVDISETEDNLFVKAELPGLEAKDVNVSISGDLLSIKDEKEKEKDEKEEHHHYIKKHV